MGSAPAPAAKQEAPPDAVSSAPTFEQLQLEQAIISSAIGALAARARNLRQNWDAVVREYQRAAAANQAAQRALRVTEQLYAAASTQFREASRAAQQADEEWRVAQALIVVAAVTDAARLDRAHVGQDFTVDELSCSQSMSTHAFRMLQDALGIDLVDKDICHIVPASLGGANHPGNYLPCPTSFNRGLGNTWNRDVCLGFGEKRCRRAIALSRKCGTYRGFGI